MDVIIVLASRQTSACVSLECISVYEPQQHRLFLKTVLRCVFCFSSLRDIPLT